MTFSFNSHFKTVRMCRGLSSYSFPIFNATFFVQIILSYLIFHLYCTIIKVSVLFTTFFPFSVLNKRIFLTSVFAGHLVSFCVGIFAYHSVVICYLPFVCIWKFFRTLGSKINTRRLPWDAIYSNHKKWQFSRFLSTSFLIQCLKTADWSLKIESWNFLKRKMCLYSLWMISSSISPNRQKQQRKTSYWPKKNLFESRLGWELHVAMDQPPVFVIKVHIFNIFQARNRQREHWGIHKSW